VGAPALAAPDQREEAERAVTLEGTRYALTDDGALELRGADGALLERLPAPGAAGLMVAAGRVWVIYQETRALPLGQAPALAAPALPATEPGAAAAAAPTEAPAPAAEIRVLRVERGAAVVSAGRGEGLVVGAPVRFLGTEVVSVPSLEGDAHEERAVERVVATGQVKILEEGRALIELQRGGRVDPGDRLEPDPGRSAWPAAPERLDDLGEVGVAIRPLLALETLGVAFINEAWFSWSFEAPWYLEARLSPVGAGWSRDGNPLSVAALAAGGYDQRYFSVGLGAGWSRLNSDPGGGSYALDDKGSSLEFQDVTGAPAVVQQARLGARDGLNLTVRNTFLLVPRYTYDYSGCDDDVYSYDYRYYYEDCVTAEEDGSEFAFGGIAMRLAVPTSARTDLVVDWGTGDAGATWVQGGVAAWLRGNGDSGSLGIEVAAGYGSLTGRPDDQYVSLYGPLVSAAMRWRL
jgi:hypothetical protein